MTSDCCSPNTSYIRCIYLRIRWCGVSYFLTSKLAKLSSEGVKFWPKFLRIGRKLRYKSWLFSFLPKKSDFPSKFGLKYRALFQVFCPLIQCVFTQKISKKLIFPQIAPKIQGTLFTFPPKKVIFLKVRLHIEHYFDFFAQ